MLVNHIRGSSPTGGSGGGGGAQSVATPKTSVVAGGVVKGTKITLTTDTKDAQIYYTIDGSTLQINLHYIVMLL